VAERRKGKPKERTTLTGDLARLGDFAAFAEALPDGTLVLSHDGAPLYVNGALCELLGYTREELLQTRGEDFAHPAAIEPSLEYERQVLRGERPPEPAVFPMRRKDGAFVLVAICSRPLTAAGRILGVVFTLREQGAPPAESVAAFTFLRAVADTASEGLALVDLRSGRFRYLNAAYAQIHGYDGPEGLLGQPWPSVFEPEWARHIEAECLPRLGKEGGWTGRLVGRRRDGSPFEQDTFLTQLPGGHGFLFHCRDISEKLASELELRQARALFRAVVDQMPRVAVLGMDRSGTLQHANQAAEALYGLPSGGATGLALAAVIRDGGRLAELQDLVRDVWESGRPSLPRTWPVVDPAGQTRWVLSALFPATVPGGVAEIFLTDVEVSEEVRATEALRRSEERLRFILDGLPGIYFYVQDAASGRWTYISRGIASVTGYVADHFLAPHEGLMTPTPENREAEERFIRTQHEGVETGPVRIEIRHRDGRPRHLEIIERPIIQDGKVTEIFGLAVDVTERAALEERLADLKRRELTGNLSRGLARELRSPLSAILATLGALQQKLAGDREVSAFAHVIQLQGRRLLKLVEDLVDLGEGDTAPRGAADLTVLAREVVASLPDGGASVRVEGPANPAVAVLSPRRIRLLVAELLDNARAFSPAGSEVLLSVTREGGLVRLSVRDSGPGFPEADLPRVTQPFFTTRPDAAGLGLALADRIAHDHEGRLEVGNRTPGPGATVTLVLPAAP